jgi:hypothetical protein
MAWGTGVTAIACHGLQGDKAADPAARSCSGENGATGRLRLCAASWPIPACALPDELLLPAAGKQCPPTSTVSTHKGSLLVTSTTTSS